MSAIPAPRSTPAARRARSRTRSKSRTSVNVAAYAFSFVVLTGGFYLASSLAGQVMVEKARREGIGARKRAYQANLAESSLRRSIDELTSFSSLEAWAAGHGFVAADQKPLVPTTFGGPTLVAENR